MIKICYINGLYNGSVFHQVIQRFKYELNAFSASKKKKNPMSKFKKNIKEYFYRLTCNQGNETYPNQLKYKMF